VGEADPAPERRATDGAADVERDRAAAHRDPLATAWRRALPDPQGGLALVGSRLGTVFTG
jgi:hypothetical protein